MPPIETTTSFLHTSGGTVHGTVVLDVRSGVALAFGEEHASYPALDYAADTATQKGALAVVTGDGSDYHRVEALDWRGHQRALAAADKSAAGDFVLAKDSADALVKVSVDGGAFVSVFGPTGVLTTLQAGYDGLTGSGSGRAVAVLAAKPITLTSATPTTDAVLNWNTAGVYCATGVPGAGVGADGDYFFRVDGTATSALYKRSGGVWEVVGVVPTMQSAYDGGGAVGTGLGRSVTTMDGGAVVFTDNRANNNNVLEVNKTPAGPQNGHCILATMGANGSGVGYAVVGDWRATAGTGLVGTGAIIKATLGGLAGPLTGQTGAFLADLSTGQHNNQILRGFSVVMPGSTSVGSAAFLVQTNQKAGYFFYADFNGGTTLTGTLTGAYLDLNTSVTGGSQQQIGCQIIVGGDAGLDANDAANTSYCAKFDYRSSKGTVAGNGIVNVEFGSAVALGANPITGVEIDLTNTSGAISGAVIGQRILIPATTRASTRGEGAIAITSAATRMAALDVGLKSTGDVPIVVYWTSATTLAAQTHIVNVDGVTNVTGGSQVVRTYFGSLPAAVAAGSAVFYAGGLQQQGYFFAGAFDGATTLSGALTGIVLNLSSFVTPGAFTVVGADITVPASSSANTCGLNISSTQTAGSGAFITMTPGSSSAVVGLAITMNANATASGLQIVHNNGVGTSGENALGIFLRSTTETGGGKKAFNMQRDSTYTSSQTISVPMCTISMIPVSSGGATTLTLSGSLLSLVHAPTTAAGGAIADTTTGLAVTMTPAAASAVTGASITMSTLATGAGLLITHNRATAAAGTISLRLAGANQAVGIELTDGQNLGVSNANEGRIRYNTNTQKLQGSENGGAWTNLF